MNKSQKCEMETHSNKQQWSDKRPFTTAQASSSVSHHYFFQYVGAEFICAVQPILKERWTAELEEAWKVSVVSPRVACATSPAVGVNQQPLQQVILGKNALRNRLDVSVRRVRAAHISLMRRLTRQDGNQRNTSLTDVEMYISLNHTRAN